MLTLKNFRKRYGNELIVSVDHLELPYGIHWIKGENGSGKSTLFKSIAGLIPFEGNIEFEGTDLKREPITFRRLVNFAEAEPLYPGFVTAKDLIHFIGRAKGFDRTQQEFLTSQFGIDRFFNKPCETYSSGMQKKLSLALAFLGSPKLVVLDEPLITLDERARTTLAEIISKRYNEGVTFLLSSHQTLELGLPLHSSYQIIEKSLKRV